VIAFYLGVLIAGMLIILVAGTFNSIPVLAFLLSLVFGLGTAAGVLWLFFLVASRFAYIPQVMLVEGLSVTSAIARSATLSGGNVTRLAALFIFTMFAAYSALALLYVPIGWYAAINGVELVTFGLESSPAWYEIASNVIWQFSIVLLSPVWMIGLCLLYIDERVRTEAYDIELMAAARLGDMPDVPVQYVNPLQPALAAKVVNAKSRGGVLTIDLR
jgi:hypothetical protein